MEIFIGNQVSFRPVSRTVKIRAFGTLSPVLYGYET